MNSKVINTFRVVNQNQTNGLGGFFGKVNGWVYTFFIPKVLPMFIIIAMLTITPLFSQGNQDDSSSQTNQEGEDPKNSEENEELKKLLEYLRQMEKYGPRTFEKEFIRNDFHDKLLKGIKESLSIISNHMQSSLVTLDHYYTIISNEFLMRNAGYYRLDFGFPIGYYNDLNKIVKIRYNFFFEKNLIFLRQVEKVFEDNSELLIQAFGEDAIYRMIFEAKYTLASILLFKNNSRYLVEAINKFEYVLGKNPYNQEIIPSEEFREQLYFSIIDIYDQLLIFNYNYHTDYIKMAFYNREKLYYLWKFIDATHTDQAIKDLKFSRLYSTYSPIMNPEGENYKNLYSKYRKETDVYPILASEEDKQESQSANQEGEQEQENAQENQATDQENSAVDKTLRQKVEELVEDEIDEQGNTQENQATDQENSPADKTLRQKVEELVEDEIDKR